mgnify:CR=1 FL=1
MFFHLVFVASVAAKDNMAWFVRVLTSVALSALGVAEGSFAGVLHDLTYAVYLTNLVYGFFHLVPLPLDLQVYAKDSFEVVERRRIEADNAYYQAVSSGWGDALRNALSQLPGYDL